MSEEDYDVILTLPKEASKEKVREIEDEIYRETGIKVSCKSRDGVYPTKELVCRIEED